MQGPLTIAICVLSVLNALLVARTYIAASSSSPHYSWKGHDYPELLPVPGGALPKAELVVEETVHYVLSAETDAIWASTAGAGYGYSRHGADHRLFMVTISHELHCLRMFNLALAGKLDFHHVKHCLDYLRHGVLCSADLTLEPGDFADRNFTRVRVGETHMCLDWSMVYDVLQTNWENWSSTKEAQS